MTIAATAQAAVNAAKILNNKAEKCTVVECAKRLLDTLDTNDILTHFLE